LVDPRVLQRVEEQGERIVRSATQPGSEGRQRIQWDEAVGRHLLLEPKREGAVGHRGARHEVRLPSRERQRGAESGGAAADDDSVEHVLAFVARLRRSRARL